MAYGLSRGFWAVRFGDGNTVILDVKSKRTYASFLASLFIFYLVEDEGT